jgi:hypothetical protein
MITYRMKSFVPMSLLAALVSSAQAVSLIDLQFSGPVGEVERQTFLDAAAYWNSAITGYDLIYDGFGVERPHALTITASIPYIDGLFGILGSAGWDTATYYDNNPVGAPTVALFYADSGQMEFDSADVAALVANNTFYGVVLHEMAHVLGIGTLWTANNNVNGTNYQLYTTNSGQYTGTNALTQWRDEFNRPLDTFVPVELAGGPGTANGHWNEADGGGGLTGIVSEDTGLDFRNELMTGWAASTFFVSKTTLGGLDDLGYIVDYSKSGIVSHVVNVPEVSSLSLCVLSGLLLGRRRRTLL